MPANYSMTWDGDNARWRKKHDGQSYVVSCKQLSKWAAKSIKPTKEGSYQEANAWWREKSASIDADRPEHPHAAEIARLERRRDWARRHADPSLAASIADQFRDVQALDAHEEPDPDGDRLAENIRVAETLFGIKVPDDIDPEVAAHYFGDRRVWQERFKRDTDLSPIPEDQTVAGHVARWLNIQRVKVGTGQLSAGRYDNNRRAIEHFRATIGGELPAEKINAKTLDTYFGVLITKVEGRSKGGEGWSAEYAKSVFGVARAFVRSLFESEVIEFPRNLESKGHRFGVTPRSVKAMSIADFKAMYAAATGQLRLHLLLMANCGMRSTDIADLKESEVDWEVGRIVRKRSKTRHHDDVPIVNYRLWEETHHLLREYRTGGDIVLRTKSGGLWAWEELTPEGKLRSSDNIATNFNRLRDDLGLTMPLASIRKCGASTLELHEHYGRYATHYLGESPRSIKDKHYAEPSVDLFDDIMKWLAGRFGFKSS